MWGKKNLLTYFIDLRAFDATGRVNLIKKKKSLESFKLVDGCIMWEIYLQRTLTRIRMSEERVKDGN